MRIRASLALAIPALALLQGICEAAFVVGVKWGISGGRWQVLAWLALPVLLRFACQDLGARLEAQAWREAVSGLRRRLLDALRQRAVPAYRPERKRALIRALGEAPRAAEGMLARFRQQAALLQGGILLGCLFLFSWRPALLAMVLAAPVWAAVRWRSRALRRAESAEAQGRSRGQEALSAFAENLESAGSGKGLESAAEDLRRDLEDAGEPEWRWHYAQSRYPALLEAGFFFALAALVLAGRAYLSGWESWILFAALLLLAYRPLREAARQHPIRLQGAAAQGAIESLTREWEALPHRALPPPGPGRALVLDGVGFRYDGGKPVAASRWILRDFGAEFDFQGITGVTGPNGTGKTTLLRLLAGAELPEAGRVRWPEALRAAGGPAYLPQRLGMAPDYPAWAAAQAALNPDLWMALDALLGLRALLSRPDFQAEGLSGGERQRLGLARVLTSDSPFLLLDEPTAALPAPDRERILRGALRIWGKGAVVVSHEPFLAAVCDSLFALSAPDAVEAPRA